MAWCSKMQSICSHIDLPRSWGCSLAVKIRPVLSLVIMLRNTPRLAGEQMGQDRSHKARVEMQIHCWIFNGPFVMTDVSWSPAMLPSLQHWLTEGHQCEDRLRGVTDFVHANETPGFPSHHDLLLLWLLISCGSPPFSPLPSPDLGPDAETGR